MHGQNAQKTFPNAVNLNEGQDYYMRKTNIQALNFFKTLLFARLPWPNSIVSTEPGS